MEISEAKSKEEFLECWPVVSELRPNLDRDQYIILILYMLDEHYKLLYIKQGGCVVAICGYRLTTMLHRGRGLYIDDLGTLSSARGNGYASALLRHVSLEAARQELSCIHLDSGPQRHEAHRLYLNHGFHISDLHFEKPVTGKHKPHEPQVLP